MMTEKGKQLKRFHEWVLDNTDKEWYLWVKCYVGKLHPTDDEFNAMAENDMKFRAIRDEFYNIWAKVG